ncbi:MAG: leucyl aminopeptidase [Candidatus Poseidoniales archaeon]
MEVKVDASANVVGTLVLPMFEDVCNGEDFDHFGIHRALLNMIEHVIDAGDFSAKTGSSLTIHNLEGKVILVGLGKSTDFDDDAARNAGASLVAKRGKQHGCEFTARLGCMDSSQAAAYLEGAILRDYSYDKYKSKDEDEDEEEDLILHAQVAAENVEALTAAARTAAQVSTGVHLARDLGNAPPNDLYPMAYAHQANNWAKEKSNVDVKIISYEAAEELGMGGLCAVGMGSDRKPCMVIFDLNPDAGNQPPVIVGKGITFDTGGISIKPSSSMDEMKYDMHGSATAFGLMQALWASGHEERIIAISCMAENMPSSNAQRPGDIITTLSGKTIEVLNTDAEGRLVLADGLWKAGEYNPSWIVDLATLTGAIVVALGHEATGMWSNDDGLAKRLRVSGAACGELIWQMPLLPAFEKEMKSSKIADLQNIGPTRWGGSNGAAAFLKQFVQKQSDEEDAKQIPWAHLDIAGTAWGAKTNKMVGHGATGIHVRALHHMITKQ